MRSMLDRLFVLRGQFLDASIFDRSRVATAMSEELLLLLDAIVTELEKRAEGGK